MGRPAHVVVLRFSALGDVALLAPVLQSAAEHNPGVKITLVTRPKFTELFRAHSLVKTFAADVGTEFAGISGLWKLSRKILSLHPDVVIDAHDHLRTKILRFFLAWFSTQIIVFDKGRKEKKSLIQLKNKSGLQPLQHTIDRYRDAFTKAGLNVPVGTEPPFKNFSSLSATPSILDSVLSKRWIGIAPFAAHLTKRWPLQRFEEMIGNFESETDFVFLLFGGGKKEKEQLDSICSRHSNAINLTGIFSLDDELKVLSRLDVMVCVDSANMHLAALSGVPVVSIWGGTHTMTGFGPFPNRLNQIIEIPVEDLHCRPCSVYGLDECPRKDHACMQGIPPERVISAVRNVLQQKSGKK